MPQLQRPWMAEQGAAPNEEVMQLSLDVFFEKNATRQTADSSHLRGYQVEAVESILDQWKSVRSTMIEHATGLGKTEIFCEIIRRRMDDGRVLCLVEREILVHQMVDRIRRRLGVDAGIEKAEYYARNQPVVVASKQTLQVQDRLSRFNPFDFNTIIIDECHHAVASGYRKILKHFADNDDLRVAGGTATADRADKRSLGMVFDSVAHIMTLLDGQENGWLVPLKQRVIDDVQLDFSRCRVSKDADLTDHQISEVVDRESVVIMCASALIKTVKPQEPTIIFCPTVQHAHHMSHQLNKYRSGSAACIEGNTPPDMRSHIISAYNDGQIDFLCNCAVATEGFDAPATRNVVILRPTKSRAMYAQMLGRGTRVLPGVVNNDMTVEERRMAIANSAKPDMRLLDFVAASDHLNLVGPADILGGEYDDDIIQAAKKRIKERGGDADPIQELREIAEEGYKAKLRKLAQIHETLQDWAPETVAIKIREIDPHNILGVRPRSTRFSDGGKSVSPEHRDLLMRNGFKQEDIDGMSYPQAREYVNKILKRVREGKCTFKMAKLMKRYGFDPDMSMTQAGRIISALKENSWRLTQEIKDMGRSFSTVEMKAPLLD